MEQLSGNEPQIQFNDDDVWHQGELDRGAVALYRSRVTFTLWLMALTLWLIFPLDHLIHSALSIKAINMLSMLDIRSIAFALLHIRRYVISLIRRKRYGVTTA